jgi:pimeloyl-ACP methyl ester carboxylesterase
MIDRGSGPPVVLIPGIQGRWEWMTPGVEALAEGHRVLTFSLGDAAGPEPWFDAWVRLIDRRLDEAGVASATITGVSFGGLIAIRYAARRASRVHKLVLVSTPSPRYRPNARQQRYLRHPLLTFPLFLAGAIGRVSPEIFAARPSWSARLRLGAEYGWRTVRARFNPPLMREWVSAWTATDLTADCARVTAPTLVITGEPGLDRVVQVASTLELLDLIPHARHTVLRGTGHVCIITKPREFASLLAHTRPHAS